ncbi:type I-E CRISPR-associated protein Cas7/Cse4/CasC, partial [Streptomyces sp. MCAF7]
RVSSQAWKRATRTAFSALLDPSELGIRTKKVAEVLAERISTLDPTLSKTAASDLAAETLRAATGSKIEVPKRKAKDSDGDADGRAPESSYLMFLSAHQLLGLAELAVEGSKGAGDIKTIKDFLKDKDNKARARKLVDTRTTKPAPASWST